MSVKKLFKMYKEVEESSELFIEYNENDLSKCQIMMFGPKDTPYEAGVFLFDVHYENYPMEPPKVKFVTGGIIQARIHPNLYREGKVCLSILGTWGENEWSPLLSTEKTFLTVKALLDKNPITNEPSFEKLPANDPKAKNYEINAEYLSLLSIQKTLEWEYLNPKFKKILKEKVEENRQFYIDKKNSMKQYDGNIYETLHHRSPLKLSNITYF